MPLSKFCNLTHLQAILTDEKKALKISEVQGPRTAILKYKEFAPKKVIPYIVRDAVLMEYFPDEIKKPGTLFSDRIFTWSVLFAVKPEWA